MIEYVVGFAFDETGRVVLIEKKRPAWQHMLLNGVGGKIEAGETPLEAMIREFGEETGVHISFWTKVLRMTYTDCIVHFYRTRVTGDILDMCHSTTDERIIMAEDNGWGIPAMVSNLSWVLPLAAYDRAEYLPIDVGVLSHSNEGR